ncbi:toll/interleukin-1 receptor domain-containing protein [Saccharothrix xinjiangensis]|uniref:Toll/interleukin-1 receptor domain-containing protein n=1 Tax=Saccharothrix xinjiangensis TaxID=204798 RepID=A0ABV9Y426_9PSEU
MGGIFINYRITTDDPEHVGRVRLLHDRLREFFGEGQVFLDARSIDLGSHFSPVIRERLDDAQIVIAVVHPGWRDTLFTRLGEEGADWVHEELRIALARIEEDDGKTRKRIVPVLVNGARHKDELTRLPTGIEGVKRHQARHFTTQDDADALIEELALHLDDGFEQFPAERTGNSRPRRWSPHLVGAAAAVGVVAGLPAPPAPELLVVSVVGLALWAVVALFNLAAGTGVNSAEASAHPLPWRDHTLRVALPLGVAWVVVVVFLLVEAADPAQVGFWVSAFGLLGTFTVVSGLLKGRRRDERRLAQWPVALSTPVRTQALRADMARLDLKLADGEQTDKRLGFGLRARCRVAIDDLLRGAALLEDDSRRSRVSWALADHPVAAAAVVLWLAATAGSARFHPLILMPAAGLAPAAVELEYRRQRMVRQAVAKEVSEHVAELRSRWAVLDRRRS